jgi:hypothetical protein
VNADPGTAAVTTGVDLLTVIGAALGQAIRDVGLPAAMAARLADAFGERLAACLREVGP